MLNRSNFFRAGSDNGEEAAGVALRVCFVALYQIRCRGWANQRNIRAVRNSPPSNPHPERGGAGIHFQNDRGRRSSAKQLTRDEAFLLAVNIAKLPNVPPNSAGRDD
jgi:hypothetical protein